MKKSILLALLAFLLIVPTTFAQDHKGKIFLSGETNLSFVRTRLETLRNNDVYDSEKQSEFEVAPAIGFFADDHFVFGLQIPVTHSSEEYYKETTFVIAPFIRRYFGISKTRPFIQGSAGFGKVSSEWYSEKITGSLFAAEIGAGLAVFLNESVALDLTIGYGYGNNKIKSNISNEYTQKLTGIATGIGIAVCL